MANSAIQNYNCTKLQQAYKRKAASDTCNPDDTTSKKLYMHKSDSYEMAATDSCFLYDDYQEHSLGH